MDSTKNFGDGVLDATKTEVNIRAQEFAKTAVDVFFDCLSDIVKNPSATIEKIRSSIEQLRNSPEMEQEIVTLWSEQLFESGLIQRSYNGLSDNLLISNFRQEGYLDGLYAGYVLVMMALVDNEVSKEKIWAVRDCVRPNLLNYHYDKRDELFNLYKDEKYIWVDRTKES